MVRKKNQRKGKSLPVNPINGIEPFLSLNQLLQQNVNEKMKSKLLVILICVFSITSTDSVYAADSDATIIVRMEPRYPHHASGEGWVKLSFDINVIGEPENIKIIDANPKGVFERAAKKALSIWRYKPAIKDGKLVRQYKNEVTLVFELES